MIYIVRNSINLPSPVRLSIWWNGGSILGLLLIIQIFTGLFLSIHYTSDINTSFNSIIHIMRDVQIGWIFRFLHANGARIFFLFLYLHIGRGLYYKSYFTQKNTWIIGVTIFLIRIATAFLGYVLPWGQISFWGATVITNLLSAIPYFGTLVVEWIWGNFSVGQPTLTRFFSLHFILPFLIIGLSVIHIVFLHEKGSSNPLGELNHLNKIPFNPYFIWKDIIGFILIIAFLIFLVYFYPNLLGDPENFTKANFKVTPNHIQPEWYFLFAYAILRSIPSKLGGVLALLISVLILYFLPFFDKKYTFKGIFWILTSVFILLTWLGACPIEDPYIILAVPSTILYFVCFFFVWKIKLKLLTLIRGKLSLHFSILRIFYTFLPLLYIYNWSRSIINILILTILLIIHLFHYFRFSLEIIFGLSSLNRVIIFLSVVVCCFAFISTPEIKKPKYIFCISILGFILIIAFSVENYVLFYVFFEASLIPTLFLVVFWGYQPERLQAGYYIIIYTVSASLPLLIILIYLFIQEKSIIFYFINVNYLYLIIIILIAFLVKIPIYTLHFWLPKAHVEASLAGSIILAGILLKLGGYGLIQIIKIFNLRGIKNIFIIFLVSISIWGAFLASIQCIRQNDIKSFVAYSSVAHISLVIVGILIDQTWGIISAIITIFAHAFSSSALFCLTYFTYKKVNSRNINYIRGMLSAFPILAVIWFIFCSINIAAPPRINLVGEIFIVSSIISLSILFILIIALLVFFSAFYNIYLYTIINHGKLSLYINPSFSIQSYQYTRILLHFFPLFFLLKIDIFI